MSRRSGVFAESYRQDLSLRRGLPAHIGTVLVVAFILLFPFVASPRWQTIGVFAAIAATGAIGLHILTGLAGQVSLGHAAFLAIGAYTATWLGLDHGLPLFVWLPAAGVAAGAVGAVAGLLAARMRGLYLAVVTLALLFVTEWLWRTWTAFTKGANGRSMVPTTLFGHNLLDRTTIAGVDLTGNQLWWFWAVGLAVVAAIFARNIQRTRMGRAFASVRERDVAAAVAGVPVTRTKVLAFVASSFVAGVSGALLGSYLSYVVPTHWSLLLSIQFIAMIVIGGLGSVMGAVLGAAFVTAIPELVRILTRVLPFMTTETRPDGGFSVELVSAFLYGAVIVVVLVFEPRGLVGLWGRVKSYFTTWPWSY